ncbi:hypothetical protein C4D60_Mb04t01560 [Musa balbisiana]|uniref:UBZ4-type domain-containing protein n=1 Tax=Musa balbisiana TaxID=52838 RepID=A0A4S8K8Z8_MUSBA|nr:hypothetical protein C4D60_Mb04t01560 [Musa balbisiana]
MLSTKSTPHPSCSSKLPAPGTGESASEKLPFQERNPILEDTPTPNFSIRDYAFAKRSKGLESSWPFTPHFLQLFLKHGVKDLLPPFETPSLVRVQCSRKGSESVQPVICSEIEQIPTHADPPVEAAIVRQQSCSLLEKPSPDRKAISCQRICKDELAHCDAVTGWIRNHEQVERTSSEIGGPSSSLSKAPSEIDVFEPTKSLQSSHESLEKKCRLIVKLGVISRSCQAEDIISNSSTVSDHMASKVCPVCKTFSSTSNTTLNAHIDQCLSMVSNNNWVSNKLLKPKVKPRKKRLMVDIYATAPHCTLEDLDRRNGTNWAIELACTTAATVGVDMEAKKPKLPTNSRDDVNERAVYVDSNGIKLRILSKLNDTPELKEEQKFLKHAEVIETTKKKFIRKKKHLSTKYSKKMKVKAQRKKLSSYLLLKAQMKTAHEGDCTMDTCYENEESINPENFPKGSGSASSRQWMCSRQSDILKKPLRKNVHCVSDNNVTRSRLAKSSHLDPGKSSVAISDQLKFSRLSEEFVSSPKMIPSMVNGFENSEKLPISTCKWSSKSTVKHGLLLRILKSSGSSVTPRIKTKEIDLDIQQESDKPSQRTKLSSKISHSSIEDQINLTWQQDDSVKRPSINLEAGKGDLSEKSFSFKNFRKHRSISKNGVEFRTAIRRGVHGPGVDISRTSNSLGSHKIGCSKKNVAIFAAGEMMNHASPNTKDVLRPEKRDDRNIMGKQKHSALKRLRLETENHDPDSENLNMQLEVFGSGNCASKSSMEMATANPSRNGIVSSENLQATFGARSELSPSAEQVQPISKSKAHKEQLVEGSEKQEVNSGSLPSEDIDGLNIQITDEMAVRGEKGSCAIELTECTADTMSVQESSGCLTSHEDVGPQMPQKGTSITSVITTTNDATNLASEDEPCGSPVSTASTLSLPSSKDSKYTDSEAEPLAIVINSQDKSDLIVPITEDTVAAAERNADDRDHEVKENLPAKEPNHSLEDKLFCCSCRESLSRESQLLRSNAAHRTTKGKQLSNFFARPRVSSSFSSYKNQRTNTMASSSLQPDGQPTFVKHSSDSSAKVPTSSVATPSSQPHNQSISSPILRLMGKNLMVVKDEELVKPQSRVLDYPSHVNFRSPPGFGSTNSLLKQENFRHHHHIFGGSPVLDSAVSMDEHKFPICLPSTPMAGYSVTPQHAFFVPRPDQQIQQKNAYKRAKSSPSPYMMNELIVISDFPETDKEPTLSSPTSTLPFAASGLNPSSQRPFTCFSSQNHIRDLPGGLRPLLPNPFTGVNTSLMRRGSTSEGRGPLLPSRFVFHSPVAARTHPSLYYSQTLR